MAVLPPDTRLRRGLARWGGTLAPRLGADLLPGVVTRGPRRIGSAPALYLTFDDGPVPQGLDGLLLSLDAVGARATFYLLGERAARFPNAVRAIQAAGHAVGAHGWSHADAWRPGSPSAASEMERAVGTLQDLTGERVASVRPPYGHLTPGLVRWCLKTERTCALWDVMPGEFLQPTCPAEAAAFVRCWARPGSVVVLHEGAPATRPLLQSLLPRLHADGWALPALAP